ncbi:tetratricopeptide repeat protein [Spirochaeta isovalerica]|uniref:Ca-activated chloride channel family protein n=1 Tax=Spirochaeta isovalerica TaxID=150 RepID=A0A841R8G6_9SPIO|nr:tetratricopeptide repeat protein [Spirochaeta isovalerica]MBB6479477.1 Ca-activated chloride channel family protein [Spirochaeta isovalerica]
MEKRLLKGLFLLSFILFFSSCNGLEPGLSVLTGNYNYQVGEFQQATINYVTGLESGRFSEWIYYNMGNVYFSLGEGGAALEVWKNVDSAEDRILRYRLNFNKGVLFYQLGRYDEAYNLFKEALRSDPASIDAKINLELTLGKLAAPAAQNGNSGNTAEKNEAVNPAETQRMLEYIRRKEGQLWFSSEKDKENYQEDW